VTGYDPLPPCSACVVRVWSTWCPLRQQGSHWRRRGEPIDVVRTQPARMGGGGNHPAGTKDGFRVSAGVVALTARAYERSDTSRNDTTAPRPSPKGTGADE
jgi:hypothetical protein